MPKVSREGAHRHDDVKTSRVFVAGCHGVQELKHHLSFFRGLFKQNSDSELLGHGAFSSLCFCGWLSPIHIHFPMDAFPSYPFNHFQRILQRKAIGLQYVLYSRRPVCHGQLCGGQGAACSRGGMGTNKWGEGLPCDCDARLYLLKSSICLLFSAHLRRQTFVYRYFFFH